MSARSPPRSPPRIIVSSATFHEKNDYHLQTVHSSPGESLERLESNTTAPPAPLRWLHCAVPWAPELIWSLLGVVILMGLVMVLSTYNNQPLPDLPLGLTLNTIVAVLATASRAVTVFLISQGISQLKWNQFVGAERPLLNLHVFDEASRGPWGSLQMVFRTRGSILAILAALLIIGSLASSTLTQSAIAYTPRLVPEPNLAAKAQYCDSYPCGDSYGGGARAARSFTDNLQAAAFGAVFNNVGRDVPVLLPRCQSADCGWPAFDTLGVCWEMHNVTDKLDVEVTSEGTGIAEQQVNWARLMNGTVFMREGEDHNTPFAETANITWIEPDMSIIGDGGGDLKFPYPRRTVSFKDDKDLLDATFSHVLMIYNNMDSSFEEPSGRYRAVEILLHFCVRTLDVKIDKGESRTRSIKSHTQVTHINEGTFTISGQGETNYFELSSEDEETKFKLKEFADLDRELGDALSGFYTARTTLEELQPGQMTRHLGLNMFTGVSFMMPAEKADKKVMDNLERVLDSLSTSMTNFMRESGRERNGTAFTSVTFVEVRWQWLTLVAAQVVLSMAFLFTVIIGTTRLGVDVVKSSNMAELFAMPALCCSDCDKRRYWEMKEACAAKGGISTEVGRDVGATLLKDGVGWRLEVKAKVPAV